MTTITVPLNKEPELAALIADMEPGDKIYGCFSIKAKDDQTLTVRLEEMAESAEDLPKADEADDDADEAAEDEAETKQEQTEEAAKKPGKTLAEKLTANSSSEY